MIRKIQISFLTLMGLIMFAFSATGQTVNMNRWIELTVTQGNLIRLAFYADSANTRVRVISGTYDTTLSVNVVTSTIETYEYFAQSTTMKIYGNVTDFYCWNNYTNITGLDASHNTFLMVLDCAGNNLSSLDVSGCVALEKLNCAGNNLSSLDVSNNTNLKDLCCGNNNLFSLDVSNNTYLEYLTCVEDNLSSLDISNNTNLKDLCCENNNLSSLDVSNNTNLRALDCSGNNLSSLDVSNLIYLAALYCNNNNFSSLDMHGLTDLHWLFCNKNNLSSLNLSGCVAMDELNCSDNNLSACGLDSIFHQLPRRTAEDKGKIYIKNTDSYTNPGTSSCRDTIATNRNWEVLDLNGTIVNTTYECNYFTIGIAEIKAEEIAAKVYPNPVSNALNIETMEKVEDIILYDVLGKEVMRTKKTNDIDVSNLNNGIYILKLMTEKGIGEYKIVKE